ncbi:50S ribosomal protein L29 [Candidatus Falkowbacteria bacterium]|nr:50S ribosomal protein L29 [Candidatus Falkowbacteria bacterium]
MKFKELKNKNDKELEADLLKVREDLQTLKFKVAGQQFKNVRAIRVAKQLIAQILTLKKQRKSGGKIEKIKAEQNTLNK